MRTILLIPTEKGIGLTSASLGLIKALDYAGLKAGFIKPFLQSDRSITDNQKTAHSRTGILAKQVFNIVSPKSISRQRVERMIGDDNLDDLMEEVVANHHTLTDKHDVIVCEGLVATAATPYATQVNQALAYALDAQVILVSTADLEQPEALADKLDVTTNEFGGVSDERTLGTILMRVQNVENTFANQPVAPGKANLTLTDDFINSVKKLSPAFETDKFHLIGVVPYSDTLSIPRTWDIGQALGATWINQGDAKNRRVKNTLLTAQTVSNIGHVFSPGSLLVTPGDRDDILIATALASMNGVPMAGIILTGGITPSDTVFELCRPAKKTGMPVMQVTTDSYQTVQNLADINKEVPSDDIARAEEVSRFVAAHLDLDWIKEHFNKGHTSRLSPSAFRHQVVKKAQAKKMRIVLPEGNEPRTIEAASICQSRGIADCILLAKRDDVEEVAKQRGIKLPDNIQIINPTSIAANYIDGMVARRKGKLDANGAAAQLKDSVVVGTMMLYQGEVDGLVSGAVHTTANTVRPAFQLIKTSPDYSLVSSIFFMLLPEQVVVYGDCAINPDPNAEELAEIAIQSAASAKAFGIEPKVAMISYSTGTSGSGEDVDKVAKATEIVKQRAPNLLVDGPLQYDAASVKSVGAKKAPNSPVAGQANVFIFPDLNTGNTTYKAVQRSANVVSVGPMLQGLNKPVNDLSRGALVDDIVYTIALTAIQANSDEL